MRAKGPHPASRRRFLKAGAAGGLVLGFFLPSHAMPPPPKVIEAPNTFLRVAPDNSVTIILDRLEFGQGVQTAMSMLVAEELDIDWSQVRTEQAPAAEMYKDPAFDMQMTGGASSTERAYIRYREVAAAARAMLVAAAARQWKLRPAQCRTARGMVLGPAGQQASYGALAEAAMQLPVPRSVVLKSPKAFRIIGKPVKRLDARAKANGRQVFGIDVKPEGGRPMVAVVAHPPVFGGKVASVDATTAKALRGVIAVLEVPLAHGGRGVAVVADGYWPARQGRALLRITWDTAGLPKTDSAAQMAQFAALSRSPGEVLRTNALPRIGTASKAISAVYEFPYLAHAPMEPLNCTVDVKADACTLWVGSQFPTIDQAAAAAAAGLRPEQVTLHVLSTGGAFGRRAVPDSDYVVEAVHIARACRAAGHGGPVKLVWSREDDIRGGYYRPSQLHRAEIRLEALGNILSWDHVIVGQRVAARAPMYEENVDGGLLLGMAAPYELPMNLSRHNTTAEVPVLWWRSLDASHTAFVIETLIDEIAHLAGEDPVAYRKKLIDPDRKRHLAALDLAVARSGYGKRRLPQGRAWGVAVHQSFDGVVAYVVEASVEKGVPKLHKVTAGVHCKLAVNPLAVEAQIQGAALMGLGMCLPGAAITLADGVVQQRNFDDYTVARMRDMPQVEVHIVPSAEWPSGVGKSGLPPLAPAFANAIFRLTGKRLRKLPFDLAGA